MSFGVISNVKSCKLVVNSDNLKTIKNLIELQIWNQVISKKVIFLDSKKGKFVIECQMKSVNI